MRNLRIDLLMTLYACMMLLTSCGTWDTMKILCIDVNNCTSRTVTLRHPQNQSVASDTNWHNQRLINVNEETREFFTITNSKEDKSCYVNVYSPEGIFQKQYKCPNFRSWFLDMRMFGDELLTYNEIAGGDLGIFVGSLLGPQFFRTKAESYNIKTKQRKTICTFASDMVKMFNSEIAIIQNPYAHYLDKDLNVKKTANRTKADIAIYNLLTKQLRYIQFPENTWPLFVKGANSDERVFWLEATEEDSDGRFITEHLFEISLDGRFTDIKHIFLNENIIGKNYVSSIIAKEIGSEIGSCEYIYVCSEPQKAPEGLNRDKVYLCRYFCDSGKIQKVNLKLGTKNEGIVAFHEHVVNGKIGLVLGTDFLKPSRYWEYFLFPPKDQYQIFDKNFNLLKSFPLPRRLINRLQIGHVFYQAYE